MYSRGPLFQAAYMSVSNYLQSRETMFFVPSQGRYQDCICLVTKGKGESVQICANVTISSSWGNSLRTHYSERPHGMTDILMPLSFSTIFDGKVTVNTSK